MYVRAMHNIIKHYDSVKACEITVMENGFPSM